jgi:hypothetical protein
VLPANDLISAFEVDTTTILSSMYLKDSVPTNGVANTLLGSYTDPVFGQLKASIYAQVFSPRISTTIIWDSNGTVCADSAVLLLPFSSVEGSYYYGNLDPQTIIVDTLESLLVTGKAYYSDTNIKVGPVPIATQQITPPNPFTNDTLKIKLSNSWFKYIIGKIEANNSYYYPNFDSLVKGFYITVSNPLQLPEQGGLWYLNLNNSFAEIYFYFHWYTIPSIEQPINFPVGVENGTGVYFNHIDRNYSIAPFNNVYPTGKHDSIPANNLVYVQSMGGVLGKIDFPNLYKNWSKKGPVIINKAELDMTVDANDGISPYTPPASIFLNAIDSLGNFIGLPDYTGVVSPSLYDGNFDPSNNTYTFVITYYIQHVIDGKTKDRGLVIVPNNESTTANRVVLYGAQHGAQTNQRIKLKIYYTPLPTSQAKKH